MEWLLGVAVLAALYILWRPGKKVPTRPVSSFTSAAARFVTSKEDDTIEIDMTQALEKSRKGKV